MYRTGYPKRCPAGRQGRTVRAEACADCVLSVRDERGRWRCDHPDYQNALGVHIVQMPPIREYSLRVRVKSVEKATPHIVEPVGRCLRGFYSDNDNMGGRTMNDQSDGELLGMLLELISTTAGIARMALGDAADQRPHSYLRRWLAEAATRFAMASSARTMLDQVTIPPEQRALIVALLEAVEGVSL